MINIIKVTVSLGNQDHEDLNLTANNCAGHISSSSVDLVLANGTKRCMFRNSRRKIVSQFHWNL